MSPITDVHLPDSEVHLWTLPVTSTSDPKPFWNVLSADERERANRFLREDDWLRFVIFRGTLRTLAARYVRRNPADLVFSYGPKGKPFIPGSWFHFNVSHSHDLAVYAFGTVELGVDVERIRDIEVEAIAGRFFTPGECTWITGSDNSAETFFDCWTRKEAYIKAEGAGLSMPLDEFSVLEPLPWQFYSWRPAEGYIAAAAVKGPKSFVHRIVQ